MKTNRILLFSNLLFIIVLVFIVIKENYHVKIMGAIELMFEKGEISNETKYLTNPEYVEALDLYKVYQSQANIVMLGNSLVYKAN